MPPLWAPCPDSKMSTRRGNSRSSSLLFFCLVVSEHFLFVPGNGKCIFSRISRKIRDSQIFSKSFWKSLRGFGTFCKFSKFSKTSDHFYGFYSFLQSAGLLAGAPPRILKLFGAGRAGPGFFSFTFS